MTGQLLFEQSTKLRGTPGKDYPVIPTPEDVNLEGLEDPYFITLPIGRIGARSRGSGRLYGESAVKSLVKQVNEQRPEGGWGHMKPSELGFTYQPPAIRWLAATLEPDGRAWGKAIVLTTEARALYEMATATNARVGTSVWGPPPTLKGNEVIDFKLFRIDIADPNLAGIEDAVGVPHVTREMTGDDKMEEVNAKEFVGEMTARVTALTTERDAALARIKELEAHEPMIAEMSTILGTEPSGLIKRVREIAAELDTARRESLIGQIEEMVRKQVKPDRAANMVIEMVSGAEDLAAAEVRLKAVLAKEFVKAFIEAASVEEQGGTHEMSDGSNGRETKGTAFEKRAEEIRNKYLPK